MDVRRHAARAVGVSTVVQMRTSRVQCPLSRWRFAGTEPPRQTEARVGRLVRWRVLRKAGVAAPKGFGRAVT